MKQKLLVLFLLFFTATGYSWGLYYQSWGNGYMVGNSQAYRPDYTDNISYSGDIIVIPSSVNGKPVLAIAASAFEGRSSLTSITLPESLTTIREKAFNGCSGLTSITIPESVTAIGNNAFQNCSGLTSITIPESVTTIGENAFAGCSSLESITLPLVGTSATSTGTSFSKMFGSSIPSSLNNVVVVKTLLSNAFSGCTGLTSVTISEGVTSIGNNAFSGCTGLTSVTISEGVTSIGNNAFNGCSGLTSVTIPESVASIGDNAFDGCSVSASFTFLSENPAVLGGINSLDNSSIFYVPKQSLEAYRTAEYWQNHAAQIIAIGSETDFDVSVEASNTQSSLHIKLGKDDLGNVVNLKVSGTINSYDLMIIRNKMPNLKSLDLADSRIVDCSYEYYSGYHSINDTWQRESLPANIISIKLPSTLNVIDDYGLSGLYFDEIIIPNSVTSIGTKAFYKCSKLKEIVVPETVESIGTDVFSGCNQLVSMDLPFVGANRSSTKMFGYFFGTDGSNGGMEIKQCDNDYGTDTRYYIPPTLKEVTIRRGNLGSGVFSRCPFTQITIGDEITSIGYHAFMECTAEIKLGKGIKSIGELAFQKCKTKSIDLYDALTTISKNAFQDASSIKRINISDISSWIKVAFYNSSSNPCSYSSSDCKMYLNGELLEDLVIPDDETKISNYAFYNYDGLKTVTAPASLMSIGASAFCGCDNLKEVTLSTGLTNIGANAFQNCTSLESCILPKQSMLTTIPQFAFAGCTSLKKMSLPTSVKYINDFAFQNCSSMAEVKISSAVNKIGNYAFAYCTNLFDVYTYTMEPQSINQQTFSQFSGATLHVPDFSFYNYFYDTQWSQFLKMEYFNEEYDYVYAENDFTLRTDDGIIRSENDNTNLTMDIWAGGAIIVDGREVQPVKDLYVKNDAESGKWGSVILHDDNLHTDSLFIEIAVKKNKWYSFSFPFEIDLTKVKKSGDWVFRRYDGKKRAENGSGGWKNIEDNVLHPNTGYIFRTNEDGTISIPVGNPSIAHEECSIPLEENISENKADQGWNFIGNPTTGYIDINDTEYTAPVVVWNENESKYDAYRPGDDECTLHPFQAVFVQCPEKKPEPEYHWNGDFIIDSQYAQSYNESQNNGRSYSKARRAKAMALNKDRQLINLTLSNGTAEDKCRVVFNEKQKMEYEAECDAAKFLSSEAVPQLYTIDEDGNQYAINERPEGNGEVMLGFVANADGEYTLSASRMDAHVAIYDYELDEAHDFADGDYTFQASAGVNNSRFALVKVCDTDVTGIASLNSENSNAVVYDLSGRAVNNPAKGVYIVNGKKTYIK